MVFAGFFDNGEARSPKFFLGRWNMFTGLCAALGRLGLYFARPGGVRSTEGWVVSHFFLVFPDFFLGGILSTSEQRQRFCEDNTSGSQGELEFIPRGDRKKKNLCQPN